MNEKQATDLFAQAQRRSGWWIPVPNARDLLIKEANGKFYVGNSSTSWNRFNSVRDAISELMRVTQ